MTDHCTQETTIKDLIEFKGLVGGKLENIEQGITDIKDNHLSHIYKEIKCITKKLSSKRPSWTVTWIITALTSACLLLLREVIR